MDGQYLESIQSCTFPRCTFHQSTERELVRLWQDLFLYYSVIFLCAGSKDSQGQFFPKTAIPASFINQLIKCSSKFSRYQVSRMMVSFCSVLSISYYSVCKIESIEKNLQYYECMTASEKQFIIEVGQRYSQVLHLVKIITFNGHGHYW